MSIELLIITVIISVIIFSVITVFVIRKLYHKSFEHKLNKLEVNKNVIAGLPIVSELSKIEAILKNEKLEALYNEWYGIYNTIKKKDLKVATDMLLDADFFMKKRDYHNLIYKMAKIEMHLYLINTKANYVLKRINEILQSEEQYRNLITNFKAKYRQLSTIYNRQKLDYYEAAKAIENQFANIEKMFKKFNKIMDQNDYDEAATIVKNINLLINQLTIVIDQTPKINHLSKNLVPKKIQELNTVYMRLIKENFNLDFLKYNYNITEIEKRLTDILDRVKSLNVEDSLIELDTISNYLDDLYNRLESEKTIRGVYEESVKIFAEKYLSLKELIKNIYIALEEIKYNYDITPGETDTIEKFNQDVDDIYGEFEHILTKAKNKEESYTKLDHMLEMVFKKLHYYDENLQEIYIAINGMKDDEVRAKEQLAEFQYLFKQCKVKLRTYKLPIIKQIYHTETREAEESINEVKKVLSSRPIRIDILNTRVDNARELVFKLYDNTNNMIKASTLAEMAIVYGNRYRNGMDLINDNLSQAERLFYKGDYNESLEISIDTIERFEKGVYEKLLKMYKELK